LCVTKQDIYEYANKHQLAYRLDESNLENTYMRNRIRQEVLPALQEENPNLAMTMQHLVQHLTEDESFVMNEAKRLFPEVVHTASSSVKAEVSAQSCLTYPTSLQRRLSRLTLDDLSEVIPKEITDKQERAFFN